MRANVEKQLSKAKTRPVFSVAIGLDFVQKQRENGPATGRNQLAKGER